MPTPFRPALTLLTQYATYHRDRRNIQTHLVGVPIIVFAIGVLLSLGLTTRTREANKQGLSFTTLVDERAAEEAYLEQQGVTLGTTPDVDEPDAVDAAPVRPLRAVS